MIPVTERNNEVVFEIKVQPGAGRTAITGLWNQVLKIKIDKKPEGGAANKACVQYLAKLFGVARFQVEIIKGHYARQKVIKIEGLDKESLLNKFELILKKPR